MLDKIKTLLKDLGITITFLPTHGNGEFNVVKNKPIIVVNDKLNKLETALTLLHETAHFLNGDCEKYIPNHLVNNNLEFQANHYMIHEVIKMLDQEYDFQPHTNYQRIIDCLDLPSHLDGVISDAFFALIQDKFDIDENDTVQDDYWWYYY